MGSKGGRRMEVEGGTVEMEEVAKGERMRGKGGRL